VKLYSGYINAINRLFSGYIEAIWDSYNNTYGICFRLNSSKKLFKERKWES